MKLTNVIEMLPPNQAVTILTRDDYAIRLKVETEDLCLIPEVMNSEVWSIEAEDYVVVITLYD